MLIPAALWVAVFICNRSTGRLAYRLTIALLNFVGFLAVGVYALATLTVSREPITPLILLLLLPGVTIVGFLVFRGFVIAWNSDQ
jgi:hypothetical protein